MAVVVQEVTRRRGSLGLYPIGDLPLFFFVPILWRQCRSNKGQIDSVPCRRSPDQMQPDATRFSPSLLYSHHRANPLRSSTPLNPCSLSNTFEAWEEIKDEVQNMQSPKLTYTTNSLDAPKPTVVDVCERRQPPASPTRKPTVPTIRPTIPSTPNDFPRLFRWSPRRPVILFDRAREVDLWARSSRGLGPGGRMSRGTRVDLIPKGGGIEWWRGSAKGGAGRRERGEPMTPRMSALS